jgi:ABC-type transport system involved in cytochrome c biogenesis permease subunit
LIGVLLIGTGVLFLMEPFIAVLSPSTYQAINQARADQRAPVLVPAGVIVLSWGVLCIGLSLPPATLATWCLLIIGPLFVLKGAATLFFPRHLAAVSRSLIARPRMWRLRCLASAAVGVALATLGLLTFSGA